MTCSVFLAAIRQVRIIPIPRAVFAAAHANQRPNPSTWSMSKTKLPRVKPAGRPIAASRHPPIAMPAAVATKAMTSSKQGQSSTGSGWIMTRPNANGMTTDRTRAAYQIHPFSLRMTWQSHLSILLSAGSSPCEAIKACDHTRYTFPEVSQPGNLRSQTVNQCGERSSRSLLPYPSCCAYRNIPLRVKCK
jgi:hypothetical protein